MIENGIHFAATNGDISLMKTLLSQNKKLSNDVNCYGMRPLHAAAFHGQVEAISVLLDYGADPNHPSSGSKFTYPLHLAVTRLHKPIIELLLVKGHADPAFKDYRGQTAIDIARNISIESDSEAKDPEISGQMVSFIKECIDKGAFDTAVNKKKKRFLFESSNQGPDPYGTLRKCKSIKSKKFEKTRKADLGSGNSFSDNEIEIFREKSQTAVELDWEGIKSSSPVMKHFIKSDII